MRKYSPTIRLIGTVVLLAALVTIATPAAADPGAGSALEVLASLDGPSGGYSTQCDWWHFWC